jgi:thiamine-phosphate pyrophosphorylase
VHLRASSLPVPAARRILGPDRLIGVSTHSADEAARAEADGADFAVLGPIYDTPSKRGYGPPIGIGTLEDACRRCRIPIFAIGGITPPRASEVRRAGAFGVAVISAVLAAEDIGDAVRRLVNAVTSPA